MRVEIGNDHAIEGYRPDPDKDLILYRSVAGEQVTRFVFPDGMGIDEAVAAVSVTMSAHMQQGALPAWVEADDPTLQVYLSALWHIAPDVKRPASWGSPTTGGKDGKSLAAGTTKKRKRGVPPEMHDPEEDS